MERSWVARLAEDLAATRAELAGLALLLAGGVLVTVVVVGRVPTGTVEDGGPAPVAATTDAGEAVPAPATAPGLAASSGAAPATSPSAGPSPTSPPGPALVHVTGAVAAPGVVEVPSGARLVDAVAAAGGTRRNAATDALNLAQPVVDGQRLHVPTRSEAAAAREASTAAALDPGTGLPLGGPGASGEPSSGATVRAGPTPIASAAPSLVDLNTAAPAVLEQLPGIGPVLAARIVAWREEHGGFQDPGQLREVSGIGDATFQDLAPLVTVS